jgi:hypothetical protein
MDDELERMWEQSWAVSMYCPTMYMEELGKTEKLQSS